MIITITMKDPDGVYDQIKEAIDDSVNGLDNLSDGEREAVRERRSEEVKEKLEKWIEYGEYLTVTFDTDAMTATVKENK